MKKGFTLVELLAVIVLLGLVGLVIMPSISESVKDSREKAYQTQLKEIKLATEKWAYKNLDLIPTADGSITVTLLQLKQSGDIKLDIRDPRTDELLPNTLTITINKKDKVFEYVVNEENLNEDIEYNELAPILVLNGGVIEYVEINSEYEDKGASAKDINGNILNDISVQYLLDNREVSEINTTDFNSYKVVYTVSNTVNGIPVSSKMIRTVIVRDTTPPEITFPIKTTVNLSSISSFNTMADVTVTDNGPGTIDVQVSNLEPSVGDKRIVYTATDRSGNTTKRTRIITVVDK